MRKNLAIFILIVLSLGFNISTSSAAGDDLEKIDELAMELKIQLEDVNYRVKQAPTVSEENMTKLLEVEKEQSKLMREVTKLNFSGFAYGGYQRQFPALDAGGSRAFEQAKLRASLYSTRDSKIEADLNIAHEWAGSYTIALEGLRFITSYHDAIITMGNVGTFFSPLTLAASTEGFAGDLDYLQSEQRLVAKLAGRDGNARFLDGLLVNLVQDEYSGQTIFAKLPYDSVLFGSQLVANSFSERAALGLNYLREANFPQRPISVAGRTQKPRGNSVLSAVGVWRPAKWLELTGEHAVSSFDDNIMQDTQEARLPGVIGRATNIELGMKLNSGAINLSYRKISPDFVSYGAQQLWDPTEKPQVVLAYDNYGEKTLMGHSKEEAELEAAPFGLATANRAGITLAGEWKLKKYGLISLGYEKLAQLKATDLSGMPSEGDTLFRYDNLGFGYVYNWGKSDFQVGYQSRLCQRDDDSATALDESYDQQTTVQGIQWDYHYNPQWQTTVAVRLLAQTGEESQQKEAVLGLHHFLDNNTRLSVLYKPYGANERVDDRFFSQGWEGAEFLARFETGF